MAWREKILDFGYLIEMSDDRYNKGDDNGKLLYCSFCGKSQHEVSNLIAGPLVFFSYDSTAAPRKRSRQAARNPALAGRR